MGSNPASFRRRKMPRGETGPTRVGGPRRRAREPHGSTDRGALCQVAASVSALQRNGEPRTPGGADQRRRPTARTARRPASAHGALAATAPAPARTALSRQWSPHQRGNPPKADALPMQPLPMQPLPRQRGQRGVEHVLFARGRDDGRFRWTAFGVESSTTSSVAQNSARYAAPLALRRAARAFSLCDRIGPEKALWRGNQELRFRGCKLRR
jgi:hypothetical protein